jgi:hypothetical protein
MLCVPWYLSFKLSHRDLVAMMGRARYRLGQYDDSAMGAAVHSGVSEALEPVARPVGGSWLRPGRHTGYLTNALLLLAIILE